MCGGFVGSAAGVRDAAVAHHFLPLLEALFHLKLSSLIFQSIDELL